MLPALTPFFWDHAFAQANIRVILPATLLAALFSFSCGPPSSPIMDAAREATVPPGTVLDEARPAARAGLGITAEWSFEVGDWPAYRTWAAASLTARGFERAGTGDAEGELSFVRSVPGDVYVVRISREPGRHPRSTGVRVGFLAHPD